MRYIIYGAGGIGGTIGARLFEHGEAVVLIARGAHADVMAKDGLRLLSPDGDRRLRIPVVRHPSEVSWTDADVALLAMKSQHTAAALEDLRAACAAEPSVVCAQNGVANERMALRHFSRVYGMLVHLPAQHLAPGEVVTHAAGRGGILDTGRYPGGVDDACVAIAAALERAGFSARPDPAVMRLKYAKLLTNLGNALQAMVTPAEDAAAEQDGHLEPAAIEVLRLLKQEALACFRAAGIDCGDRDTLQERQAGVYRMAEVPGHPRVGGSSWQSLVRGTGSLETDYLNGEIVLLGRLHGVPTPANAACQALIREMLRGRLPAGTFDGAQVLARVRAAVAAGA